MARRLRCSCSPDLPTRIEIVPETGSTSADIVARIGAGDPIPEGYWLIADRQSAGRGRQGRRWLDAPGNLMGSTVVAIGAGDPAPSTLSFVAALAVYEAVVLHLGNPRALQLKWPNDLLLGREKLSGILLERIGSAAVIGIGVNLAVAPNLADREASHIGGVGPAPARDAFAGDLAASFDRELVRWRQFGTESLLERWLAVGHPLGSPLSVHGSDGARVSGSFDGLEPDGALRLRLADGTCRVIHAGDVVLEGN